MRQRSFIAGLGLAAAAGLCLGLLARGGPPPESSAVVPAAPLPAPSTPAPGASPGFVGVVIAEGSVDISARFEGQLRAVLVQVGDAVHPGQALARLDEQPLQHERALTEADVRAARAEEEVARLALAEARESLERGADPRLVGLGALSAEEQARLRYAEQKALARLETARAQVQRHQTRLEQLRLLLSEATLVAPFEGRVSRRYLDAGARVAAGQPIVHLLQDGPLQVRFAIPEARAHQVAVGTPVRIQPQAEGRPLWGRVEHVAPEIHPVSRMVLAIARLAPSAGQPLPFGAIVRVSPDATPVADASP